MVATLYSMLGSGITGKAPYQWVKTFGRGNILSNPDNDEPLLIKNDYICKAFYASKELGRTTEELANVMIYTYYRWTLRPENTRITGIIAEEIHNRAMKAIATYYKRNWDPSKHKCPTYGIVNLFKIIRSTTQAELLPPKPGQVKVWGSHKGKFQRQFLDNLEGSEVLCNSEEHIDYMHTIAEWDTYRHETPLEVLIYKEMETSNGV